MGKACAIYVQNIEIDMRKPSIPTNYHVKIFFSSKVWSFCQNITLKNTHIWCLFSPLYCRQLCPFAKAPFTNQEFSSAELSASSKLRGGMTLMPTNKCQSLFVGIRVIPPSNLELADNSAELNSWFVKGMPVARGVRGFGRTPHTHQKVHFFTLKGPLFTVQDFFFKRGLTGIFHW